MNIRYLVLLSFSFIFGCSSEYGPGDFEVSDKGAFVEKGSSSLISGEVVIEKTNGGSLIVEFDDGLPDGDVIMRDAENNVVLESAFVPKTDLSSVGRGGGAFINEMISRAGGQLSTRDYLNLFEDFAEYDGDYLKVSDKKKTQGHYSNGEKDEHWEVFCENGQLESDVRYKHFEEGGKKVIKKIGKESFYNCDGDVLLSAERDKKGRLQGEYFEATSNRYNFSKTESKKPQPKYSRNYKDGELDGAQKEYYRDGTLKVENNFKLGVKDGLEKLYDTKTNYSTREKVYGLKEIKNYSNGQLNGRFERYDLNQKVILSGQYSNGKPVGQWTDIKNNGAKKTVTDYDANNFIVDKAKAFKKACFIPTIGSNIRWSNKKRNLTNCEYYVENNIVDINKKISFDLYGDFEKSSKWSFMAVAAQPEVYEYLKKHGLKTRVVDSVGRSRLHQCIEVSRPSTSRKACSTEQAIAYIDDVDLNAVSNVGTVLHQLVSRRSYGTTKSFYVEEDLKIAKAMLEKGANVNQLNYKNESALMHALTNSEYKIADFLLDAGASIDVKDSSGRTTIGRLFFDHRNRWKSKKINAEGTRVLAKIIALGGDTSVPIQNGKTVVDFSEENNTIHHIQTLKDAQSMSKEFAGSWKSNAEQNRKPVSQGFVTETASIKNSVHRDENVVPVNVAETKKQVAPKVDEKPLTQSVARQSPVTPEGDDGQSQLETVQVSESEDRATALLREQANFLVEQANDHIKASRLKTPKNNSALSSLEQLKKIDPENENIAVIENAIGKKYLSLASGKINKGDKRGAQNYLNSADEFIEDEAVISDFQQRINSYVAPAAPVAKVTNTQSTTSSTVNRSQPTLACDPSVRAAGVPVLGRSFTAKQSLPRTQATILSTAKRVIQRTYSNVQQSNNKITYQQATKGKPIKFTLTVQRDGNNTQLSIKAKTPAGLVSTKSAYKSEFCKIVAEL